MTAAANLPSPTISPSPDAAPFWDAARRKELYLPFCGTCQQYFFYPRTLCPHCGARDVQWRQASGRGRLYTFCIQYRSSIPGYRDAVPFVTAIVELAEGPRLMTILVDVEPSPEAITCDMPVQVAFLDLADGQSLPVFKPAA